MAAEFVEHLLYRSGTLHQNTMRVLPSSKSKKRDKLAVGDQNGVVHVLSVKRGGGQLEPVYKTTPFRREVTALGVCGELVYAAFGQCIQSFHKKRPNIILNYTPVLSEDISILMARDHVIYTGCDFSVNVFVHNRDTNEVSDRDYYQAADRVHSMAIMRLPEHQLDSVVIGCQDCYIRVIDGSVVYDQVRVEGPVYSLYSMTTRKSDAIVFYGTQNGFVGKLSVADDKLKADVLTKGSSSVTALCSVDLSHYGGSASDIIIGRDDGRIEIYSFEHSANLQDTPRLIYQKELGESITAIDTGRFINTDRRDIVVATYSGKISGFAIQESKHIAFSMSNEFLQTTTARTSVQGNQISIAHSNTAAIVKSFEDNLDAGRDITNKINVIKNEIDKLVSTIDAAKKKAYGPEELIAQESSPNEYFNIKSSLTLMSEETYFLLGVEIPYPIDVLILQSKLSILLLDFNDNQTLLSRSPPDPKNGNVLLATYRCQEHINRVEIKLLTVEGHSGTLNLFAIPKTAPKTCQRFSHIIKPLSLHERYNYSMAEQQLDSRPFNTLTIQGFFSLTDINSWIRFTLPDIPTRLNEVHVRLGFRNTFLGTVLLCIYEAGHAILRSDNITTLSILKETISNEAGLLKINLDIDMDIKRTSLTAVLEKIRPRLDRLLSLERKQSLIEPLKEIQTHEQDTSFLCSEYQDIIQNTQQIESELKQVPRHLHFLRAIVTDLFADFHKLQGRMWQSKMPRLEDALVHNYDFNKVIAVFEEA